MIQHDNGVHNPLTDLIKKDSFIYQGLPELEKTDKSLSFFEFWPGTIIYLPVVIQWLVLSIRYHSLTLPLSANPNIPLSGMVGESKSGIFSQASVEANSKIAQWLVFTVTNDKHQTLSSALQQMTNNDLTFPLVAKPDIGCRGSGVRIVRCESALAEYINHFPFDSKIVLQKLVPYEAEAGIFFIRDPRQAEGEVFSITLKYSPYVVGNGFDNLEQLIRKDKRASKLAHLYLSKHKAHLSRIIPQGQAFRLTFSGSHCRGSIFRDGRKYITPALTHAINSLCKGLPEFYYGRIDLRFKNIDSLMRGEDFQVLEINGASSEAAHIWDSRSSLKELYRVLFYQYRTLFRLGAINRKRGFAPPSFFQLIKAWRKEKSLINHYPETE